MTDERDACPNCGAPTEAFLAARNGHTREHARATLTPKGKARASLGKKIPPAVRSPR